MKYGRPLSRTFLNDSNDALFARYDWPHILVGIVLAGSIYSAFLATLVMWMEPGPSFLEVIMIFVIFVLVGLLATAAVAIVVSAIGRLFLWSMKWSWNPLWFGAVCGGLVGF